MLRGLSCKGGGVWVGGSKALEPPPLFVIPRVSRVGLLPPLLSLVTGALSGCLLVPLSALLLCRHQCQNLFVVVGYSLDPLNRPKGSI